MSEPVFLPLMTEPQPETDERARLAVQAIPFALPEIRFSETAVRRMSYEGTPVVFRIEDRK